MECQGALGSADAIFGAVECQKSAGCLHYHFFLFVQRLHQYATIAEIGEKFASKLVVASELKDFLSNICCESYSDLQGHLANVGYLESYFPQDTEHTEFLCDLTWGGIKIGRIR